jgi:hypothetical protein
MKSDPRSLKRRPSRKPKHKLPLRKDYVVDRHSVEDSRYTCDGDGGKHIDSFKKHESLSLHDIIFSFITSLMSNLYTAVTRRNTTENNCIFSHAENRTALQPNVLTGIHRLLVTNKGWSPSTSVNKSQVQLQTPQSVSLQH